MCVGTVELLLGRGNAAQLGQAQSQSSSIRITFQKRERHIRVLTSEQKFAAVSAHPREVDPRGPHGDRVAIVFDQMN